MSDFLHRLLEALSVSVEEEEEAPTPSTTPDSVNYDADVLSFSLLCVQDLPDGLAARIINITYEERFGLCVTLSYGAPIHAITTLLPKLWHMKQLDKEVDVIVHARPEEDEAWNTPSPLILG